MTSFSTHVLDTTHGRPAAGMAIELHGPGLAVSAVTNEDGRCPGLVAEPLAPGRYTLRFAVAAYFRGCGIALSDPPFLDQVTIDFGVAAEGSHYHVPLLISPYGYSTYRGS